MQGLLIYSDGDTGLTHSYVIVQFVYAAAEAKPVVYQVVIVLVQRFGVADFGNLHLVTFKAEQAHNIQHLLRSKVVVGQGLLKHTQFSALKTAVADSLF